MTGVQHLVGRLLGGRYRVERPLGQGGMGAVYAAVQIDLDRPVALKTLLDVTDPRDLERLRTEALAAASLAHPHIVQVSDFVEARGDDPTFLVMELLPGKPLGRVLAERGPLPVDMAVRIALQMLDALGAAHRAGIVHRDVKPANVMVLEGADGAAWIKLVDFGIAKLLTVDGKRTTTGTLIGTPAYMAPEQLLGVSATAASDVYAVGVCLFEMLVGRRLFTGQGGELVARVLGDDRPDPCAGAAVPRAVGDVVARAIRRDPAERFATADDLARALREATAAPREGAARVEATPSAKPATAAARWPIFALALSGTLVVGLAVALVSALRRPPPADLAPPREEPRPSTSIPAGDERADAAAPPPIAAPEPHADEAPPPLASAAPARNTSRAVRSLCSDGGRFALCPELVYRCECEGGHGTIHEDAKAWSRTLVRREHDQALEGKPCAGFVVFSHTGSRETAPATGTWRCTTKCDDEERRRGIRLAVPGTPCTGYVIGERREGRWVAVKD